MTTLKSRVEYALTVAGITKDSGRLTKITGVINGLIRQKRITPEQRAEAVKIAKEWVG